MRSDALVSVDDRDASVGVEHDLHIGFRSSARLVVPRRIGCLSGSNRCQKSPQASPSARGESTRALPRRSMATSEPGKRIALGRRTAWLPPDQKSLARVAINLYMNHI